MSSLLLVTADVDFSEKAEAVARSHGFRVRTVSSIDAAKEWLSMQSFTTMIVDARYEEARALDLLSLAWMHHPYLAGCLFSPHENFSDKWSATLMGARVFAGENALSNLDSWLKSLPLSFPLTEKTHFAVLVVEDLDAARDIVSAYIESLGYSRVDSTSSAEQALLKLREDPFLYFAVVTDILMPKTNGIELIRAIRQDITLEDIPAIALTAVPTVENLIECIKAGATGFLAKPPKKNALRAELEKAKRILLTKQPARLCSAEDAHHLEDALRKKGIL